MEEQLILVDEQDNVIGCSGKLAAHKYGLLHRAFSIFLFDELGRTLLQRRALDKYHSGGLWANTCCGHPRLVLTQAEDLSLAASRRLFEEMGIEQELYKQFSTMYKVHIVESGLYEHELVHVFAARIAGEIKPNPQEVMDYQWLTWDEIVSSLELKQHQFAYWFKFYFAQHKKEMQELFRKFE